jgi:hydrogenase maturation protein HypF
VRALVDDVCAGTPREIVAARFHNGMAEAIVAVCDIIRGEHDLNTTAISGGVFQNALLLERTSQRLRSGCDCRRSRRRSRTVMSAGGPRGRLQSLK